MKEESSPGRPNPVLRMNSPSVFCFFRYRGFNVRNLWLKSRHIPYVQHILAIQYGFDDKERDAGLKAEQSDAGDFHAKVIPREGALAEF